MPNQTKKTWAKELDQMLFDYLPDLRVFSEEPLSRHTSFRIGGAAKRMAFPSNREQTVLLIDFARQVGARFLILGNGTNVLFGDDGLDALVINTSDSLRTVHLLEGNVIEADAGASLASLGLFAQQHNLTGVEFAHGIPGSLGGAIVMNAGAYGGEMKDILLSATVLFPDGICTLDASELALGYRRSIFTEQTDAVILGARLKLQTGEGSVIKARMDELAAKRRASQPLEWPSAGSTFKRPDGHFAGALIEQCRLKGLRVGGAEVSTKHAGFVINVGGATCRDVLTLIEKIQHTVRKETGVQLEPEVKIIH